MTGKIKTEEARQLHAQGISDGDIARHFGVTQSGATRWRHKQGLPPNAPPKALPQLPDEKTRRARKLLREGMTLEQVARDVGCSRRTVVKIRAKIKNDTRLHTSGKSLSSVRNAARRDAVAILAELKTATRHVTDAAIRDDVMGDMFLAMMEGRLERQQIKNEARRYSGRAIDQWQSRWAPASIDEALTEDGLRLVDLIPCPDAAAWLESVGA